MEFGNSPNMRTWLDALAERLERRAEGLTKMSRIDSADGQVARTLKIAYEEISEELRACVESASNPAICDVAKAKE